MKMIEIKDHGLTARKGLDDNRMNRKQMRAYEKMTVGRRFEEALAMCQELEKFAKKHNDVAIAHNLVTKFYPYVRAYKRLPMSKKVSDELRKLYDLTREDVRNAYFEDVANGL